MLPAVITPLPPLPVMAMDTAGAVCGRAATVIIVSFLAHLTIGALRWRRIDLDQTARAKIGP
jgi:hypothetical protein